MNTSLSNQRKAFTWWNTLSESKKSMIRKEKNVQYMSVEQINSLYLEITNEEIKEGETIWEFLN